MRDMVTFPQIEQILEILDESKLHFIMKDGDVVKDIM